jgi:dsDNA-specific endonuclease/ATPase MutS2
MAEATGIVPTGILEHVNGWFSLAGLLLLCATPILIVWINKIAKEGKALAEANKENIETNKRLEKKEIEERGMIREQQIKETNGRVDDVVKRLDEHISADKANDEETRRRFDKITETLSTVKENMVLRNEQAEMYNKINKMNELIVEMSATQRERARHEHT